MCEARLKADQWLERGLGGAAELADRVLERVVEIADQQQHVDQQERQDADQDRVGDRAAPTSMKSSSVIRRNEVSAATVNPAATNDVPRIALIRMIIRRDRVLLALDPVM